MAISARLGSARKTLEMLMARNEPWWRWPSQIPSGSASASEMTMASTAIPTCAIVFSRIRPALSPKNWNRSITPSASVHAPTA